MMIRPRTRLFELSWVFALASLCSTGCLEYEQRLAKAARENWSATGGPSTTDETTRGDTTAADTTAADTTAAPESESSGSGGEGTSTGGDSSATDGSSSGSSTGTTGGGPDCECTEGPRCHDCLLDRLIFVSSSSHQGDFGPLAVADEICQGLLPARYAAEKRTMRAWLSGANYDAGTRFTRGKGRYLLPDGQTVVVTSGDDLVGGTLVNSISMDEQGATREVPVWTNTNADGLKISPDAHCEGWSTNSIFEKAWYGWSTATDFQWTRREVLSNPEVCAFYAHLYCVEQAGQP